MLKKIFHRKKNEDLTDEELLVQYRKTGNNALVGVLYTRYTHLVFGVCMKYLKNEDDAQDMTLVIFEDLMEKLLKTEVQYFKSWLYQVSKNHCLMKLRKAQTVFKKEEEYKKNVLPDMESEQEAHLIVEDEKEQELQRLEAAVETLGEEQKRCVKMFFFEEKSYQQIAQETGYSLKQVKSYLQNGKYNLKKQMLAQRICWLIMLWYSCQ